MWHKFSGAGVDWLSVMLQWFVWLHQFVRDENRNHYVLDWFKKNSTIYFYFPSLPLKACNKCQENTYKATAKLITATQFPGWWFPWAQGQVWGTWQKMRVGLLEIYSSEHSTQQVAVSTSPPPPLQCTHMVAGTMVPAFASESFLKKGRGKELKEKDFFTV